MLFHVLVHAKPNQSLRTSRFTWSGDEITQLEIRNEWLTNPLPATFDEVLINLSKIERCYTEPDGSFLWTHSLGPSGWQIDGQLNDSAHGLMHVELKLTRGSKAADLQSAVQRLLEMGLEAPRHQTVIQLIRPGVYVAAEEFLRLVEIQD